MQGINSVLNQWQNSMNGKLFGTDGEVGDAFSSLFNRTFGNTGGTSAVESALAKLAERFPGLSVKAGEVGEGLEAAKEYYKDDSKDQVTVSPDMLSSLGANSDLAKQLEEILGKLFDGSTNPLMQQMDGAYTQRTVTITVTTIRYVEFQRSDSTGDIEAAADLRGKLQDRIKEMIDKFFGLGKTDEEEETGDVAETEQTDGGKQSSASQSGFAAGWSFEFYYSGAMLSRLNDQSASGQQWQYSGFGFSASLSSFMGKYSNVFSGNAFNSFGVSGYNNASLPNLTSSPFFGNASFMAESLRLSGDGLFFNLRSSQNLLADLMNRLTGGQGAKETTDAEMADMADPEGESVDEEALEAVGE